MIAISADDDDASERTAARLALTYPVLADPTRETIKAYRVYDDAFDIALPAVFIVDGGGVVRAKLIGTRSERPPARLVLETAATATLVRPAELLLAAWARLKHASP